MQDYQIYFPEFLGGINSSRVISVKVECVKSRVWKLREVILDSFKFFGSNLLVVHSVHI